MEENIKIEISEQIEEKRKLLLTENINLVFRMKRKIIQRYIDALNIEVQINVNHLLF